MRWLVLPLCLMLFVLGCPSEEGDDDSSEAGDDDDATAGDDDDSAPGDDDDTTGPSVCAETGLDPREFIEASDDEALYAVAADFTVPTRGGAWTLSENFNGCDTFLFISDSPQQAQGWPTALWDRDVDTFLNNLPTNVQVFFASDSWNGSTREEALDGVEAEVEAALAGMSTEDGNHWRSRIHYVTEASDLLDGWIGEVMGRPGWGVGIDGFQRIRYIGSYADWERYSQSAGWFEPNLAMAANEAVYYNFESIRGARLDEQSATVVPVFSGDVLSDPNWAGTRHHADVTLPDAATMATFDSMELDLYLGCEGDGEYGDCPAWDYLVYMYLCDAADPDSCGTEFGRWITTYHREGRWVHDVSGLLPLIADGGERRFAFYTQQPYEVELSIRLFDSAKPERPEEATYLFSGGSFNDTYNDNYEPVTVAIPSDAVKVELATVITGHGGADPGNCAEFCNTTHHFDVNGIEVMRDFPEASTSTDCMDKVAEGTVPNQYGTWWYGRSGWCPGKEVQLVMQDITAHVPPGEDTTVDYEGYYNGAPYPSSGASIVLSSWVVVSR
jgi:hypothetical protein